MAKAACMLSQKTGSLTTGSYESLRKQKVQTKVELHGAWLSVEI